MNIWITSDTHYSHKNIAGSSVSSWKSGYRNFGSVQEMNDTIVENINKYVKEDDILYHLGDWSFGGAHNILLFRNSIVCRNIHLILGNHDTHIKDQEIKYFGGSFNPMTLFSSVQDVLYVPIHRNKLFLSHYAHRVWPDSHKGSIHLYGHSHNTLPTYGKSMDVCLESAYQYYGEWRPFHINDIYQIMDKREIAL